MKRNMARPVRTPLIPALVLGLTAAMVSAQTQNQAPTPAPKTANQGKSTPALPQRDVLIELRQITDVQGGGYSVSTRPQDPMMAPQQLRVRNGQQATLRLGQNIPLQWTQSVFSQQSKLTAPGVELSNQGGGVTQAVTWLDAGQSIVLRPRWPGGNQDATVEVEVQSAKVQERTGTDLPTRSSQEMVTVVTAPLGQWVTLAATGVVPQKGVYGTQSSSEPRRLLQVRIQLP